MSPSMLEGAPIVLHGDREPRVRGAHLISTAFALACFWTLCNASCTMRNTQVLCSSGKSGGKSSACTLMRRPVGREISRDNQPSAAVVDGGDEVFGRAKSKRAMAD